VPRPKKQEGREAHTGYVPRKQFIPFHKRTERFACLVCHRAAGKTVACINDLIRAVLDAPPGAKFAYIAPYLKQAKSVAWGYLRQACAPIVDLGVATNESDLRIDFSKGRSIRLFGADNPESIRGNHFHGIIADEYADWDASVWPLIVRATLSAHRGRAVFIGTPKGKNAFYQVWKDAQDDPEWFSMMLKASDSGILDAEELASAKKQQTEDQYQQEYECNFDAAVQGAYYAKLIAKAREDGRIMGVPYDPSALVWTAWDLGIRDATAIWFAQVIGREIHLIDYYEASGVDLGAHVAALRERPYVYAHHLMPHDAQAKELGTGKTRIETLEGLGLFNCKVVTQHRVEDGINAARLLLPKCYFDSRKCDRGIEALTLYRADVDNKYIDPTTKQPLLKGGAVHDWTSHCADAFRYLAMGIDDKGVSSAFNKPITYPNLGLA